SATPSAARRKRREATARPPGNGLSCDEFGRNLGRTPRDTAGRDSKKVLSERDTHMRKFAEKVVNFLKREDGPTAVEYAVMLALIIVVCITAITALGTNANKTFTTVGNTIGAAS